jgi:hypothetical protein
MMPPTDAKFLDWGITQLLNQVRVGFSHNQAHASQANAPPLLAVQ